MKGWYCSVVVALILVCSSLKVTSGARCALTGVNEASAEFAPGTLPGTYGTDYVYPTQGSIDYMYGKGFNVIRLPFSWERLQRSAQSAFDSTEQGYLTSNVSYITGKGMYVLIDPHNYARYYGTVITAAGTVSYAVFNDLWTRLSNLFKNNDHVIFGIMNEPHDMPTETWRDAANSAISAIRATGATNLITVPGNGYTGGANWFLNWYGTPNSAVMTSISDPLNNFAIEIHQYFDSNYVGTSDQCQSATIGTDALSPVTTWLRNNNLKAFLGEFGAGNNAQCQACISNVLNHLDTNSDVWVGWTWWAAGPMWPSNYVYLIEPTSGSTGDRPQTAWLTPHVSDGSNPVPGISQSATPSFGSSQSRSKSQSASISITSSVSLSPSAFIGSGGGGGNDVQVYTNALQGSWSLDWSWGNRAFNTNDNSLFYSTYGNSLSWNPAGFDGLYYTCNTNDPPPNCFDSSYYGIAFWANANNNGNFVLRVQMRRLKDTVGVYVNVTVSGNQWVRTVIPMTQFNTGGGYFNSFSIQESTGAPPNKNVYFNDVRVLSQNPGGSTVTPTRSITNSITTSLSTTSTTTTSISTTRTATNSVSITSSTSTSISGSRTATNSVTLTPSASVTSSLSFSRSVGASYSATMSLSVSGSATTTRTASGSGSLTSTASTSLSGSSTVSASYSVSVTPSRSVGASYSATMSLSVSGSATASVGSVGSASGSSSPSAEASPDVAADGGLTQGDGGAGSRLESFLSTIL